MALRRGRARQPSSDGIEEQAVSQRSRATRTQEDVSDDNSNGEQQQTARRQRESTAAASRTKGTSKVATASRISASRRKKAASVSSSSEADNDEEVVARSDRIDVSNFTDQPLLRTDSKKVSMLAGDWEMVISNIKSTALTLARDVAVGMAEAGLGKDEEAALKELEKIEETMHELLDTQAELKSHQAALEDLCNRIATGDQIPDIVNQYDKGVQERMGIWASKTSRQKYAKDEKFIDFKTGIFEVQHPEEPMPPLTELIPKEDGDESDDDDEIEIGGVTQDYKCMLTLQTLEEPLRSNLCKHSFSGAAIRDYLGTNRSAKKKCPATGCSAYVGLDDFKPDKELDKNVKAYKRRRMAREAEMESDNDDDDGEVL